MLGKEFTNQRIYSPSVMLVPGSLAVLHMHVGVHYISACTRIIVLQVHAQLQVTKENTDTYKYNHLGAYYIMHCKYHWTCILLHPG